MKSRPILFSAPMVRAILDGRKTQTRRIVKFPQIDRDFGCELSGNELGKTDAYRLCPYGQPGDQLWVREAWQYYDWNEEGEPCIRFAADNATTWPEPGTDEWADRLVDIWETLSRDKNFNIDNRARDRRWRPSIHMPRWASRITLEIVSVRIGRLNDISEADAQAEGARRFDDLPSTHPFGQDHRWSTGTPTATDQCLGSARFAFGNLWEKINGAGSWDANPWVWVVEFKRVES